MTRQTDVRRNSRPVSSELFSSPEIKAELEARNGLVQFDDVRKRIGGGIASDSFKLRPSTIIDLQRLAIQDIYSCAGTLRQDGVVNKGYDAQAAILGDSPVPNGRDVRLR